MIVRQVSDVMDAEELAQDTFIRAFSHIDHYDPQKASLSTWLCRIAYRLTLDFLKRRRPLIVPIEDSEVWQTDISDEQLESTVCDHCGRSIRLAKEPTPGFKYSFIVGLLSIYLPMQVCLYVFHTTFLQALLYSLPVVAVSLVVVAYLTLRSLFFGL